MIGIALQLAALAVGLATFIMLLRVALAGFGAGSVENSDAAMAYVLAGSAIFALVFVPGQPNWQTQVATVGMASFLGAAAHRILRTEQQRAARIQAGGTGVGTGADVDDDEQLAAASGDA